MVLNTEKPYRFPEHGQEPLCHRPVIVGFGPAGMFCGLMLARAGFSPLILERGEDVDSRTQKVEAFWRGGELNPDRMSSSVRAEQEPSRMESLTHW